MNTKDDKMARYRELANRPLTEHSNPGIAAFYRRLHEESSPLLHSAFDGQLLCAIYGHGTAGKDFEYLLVISADNAKSCLWYKTFAEFYEAVKGDYSPPELKPVPNESYSMAACKVPGYVGNDMPRLTRFLKERPEKGKGIVDAVIADEKEGARQMVVVDSLVQAIKEAELSDSAIGLLASRARTPDDIDIPF